MTRVTIEVTHDQAIAIRDALECYTRLCIGQLEHVAEMLNEGTIPVGSLHNGEPRKTASREVIDDTDRAMRGLKHLLGYSANGSNGIGHGHVCIRGKRAWEIRKALSKALAEHRDPAPSFRGVDYDGRIVRYTGDPDAIVRVEE